MNSCFLGAYAVGGIFTGQLADKYRLRVFIPVMYSAIGLSMCSLGLLKFLFKTPEEQRDHLYYYYVLKVINGTIQSPGWALNLVILTNWFPRTGRGLLLGCWACNTSIGDLIGTNVYKLFSDDPNHWSRSFFIIAIFVCLVGVINLLFLVQDPEEVGLQIRPR